MSTQSDRVLRGVSEKALAQITAQAQALAELHSTNGRKRAKCVECGTRWPCRTRRIVGEPKS